MPTVVTSNNRHDHGAMLDAMHADRKRVFVDQLKWQLPVTGDREIDEYDTADAIYLIVQDPVTAGHLGSVRLVPTSGPHLLGDKFACLCDVGVPTGDGIWEITRLCTTPEVSGGRALAIRMQLVLALVEFGQLAGVRSYTMMTHMAYLPALLAVGWDLEPLGLPHDIGGEQIAALRITLHPETLGKLRALHDFTRPVLCTDGLESALAA